jgi:hypothetical protein
MPQHACTARQAAGTPHPLMSTQEMVASLLDPLSNCTGAALACCMQRPQGTWQPACGRLSPSSPGWLCPCCHSARAVLWDLRGCPAAAPHPLPLAPACQGCKHEPRDRCTRQPLSEQVATRTSKQKELPGARLRLATFSRSALMHSRNTGIASRCLCTPAAEPHARGALNSALPDRSDRALGECAAAQLPLN